MTFSRWPILADVAEAPIQIRQGQKGRALQTIERLTTRSQENEIASALAILHFHRATPMKGFAGWK
ncbi:hypothetical protein ACFLSZ_04130 [Candidatus Bipolaricaulota bacterium]